MSSSQICTLWYLIVWKLEFYCQTLLNICVEKTQKFRTFTLLYWTLLVYLQLWFFFRRTISKRAETWSPPNTEHQKLQRFDTQGGAAYGSVLKLVKTNRLRALKMRQFLLWKPSYTIYILATFRIKRMKAFATFENEIWCMDLANVGKVAIKNEGEMFLLVPQDFFDRPEDAKRMKTKDSKKIFKRL